MAGNARFHNKWHRKDHHSRPTPGFPSSATDPIASKEEPFVGDMVLANSLCARGDLKIDGNATIIGNLSVFGDLSYLDTVVSVTSALSVVNLGTGPALTVMQLGAQPIARFIDADGPGGLSAYALSLEDNGQAVFSGTFPSLDRRVSIYGTVSASGNTEFQAGSASGNRNLAANSGRAFGTDSAAFGSGLATGTFALAEGQNSVASGRASHAEGVNVTASSIGSHAEGISTTASASAAHAEGRGTSANQPFAHAEGLTTLASGSAAHAEGTGTIAGGNYSHAEGQGSQSIGSYAHAEGDTTFAIGNASHAEGSGTTANGIGSHAEGSSTTANADYSHAEGSGTTANADCSHAEGLTTLAGAVASHAEGTSTTASGVASHAEGISNTASASGAHAEGFNTQATNSFAHAEGRSTTASGSASHAEGSSCIASGEVSHAQGIGTRASGTGAHTGGFATSASGIYSFAHGRYTQATKQDSISLGFSARAVHDDSFVFSSKSGNVYSSTSFANDTFNVYATGGIELFDPVTVGDPMSAVTFIVTTSSTVGINIFNPLEALTVVGNISASGSLSAIGAAPNYFVGNVGIGLSANKPTARLTVLSGASAVNPDNAFGTTIHSSNDGGINRIVMDSFGGQYAVYTGRAARGSSLAPTAVQNGDKIVEITGRGRAATAYPSSSNVRMNMYAGQTFTDIANGTFINFEITPPNTTVATPIAQLSSTGLAVFGSISATADITSNTNISAIGSLSAFNAVLKNALLVPVISATNLTAFNASIYGILSSGAGILANSLTSRFIDIVHTPATDGINPVLRIGEFDTATAGNVGFSGAFLSYNENTNVFGISSVFAPAAGIPAISINRISNVGVNTDTPNQKLTVRGSMSASDAVFASVAVLSSNNDASGLSPTYLRINNNSGNPSNNGGAMIFTQDGATYGRVASFFDNALTDWRFTIGAGTTPSICMSNTTGNVGIGSTNTAAEKLTVTGNISSNGSANVVSLSSRFITLVHTPANDGTNARFDIGEYDTVTAGNQGFSGFSVEYNEINNKLVTRSTFAGSATLTATAMDRFGTIEQPNGWYISSVSQVSAAGTNQATATPIYTVITTVTGAGVGLGGLLLPPTSGGNIVYIYNFSGNNAGVYPQPGGRIYGLSNNAAYNVATGTYLPFQSLSANFWSTII
jgi:hypothetical protein